MRARCKRDCTIPGRGLVVKGQGIDIPDPDVPWAKHFDLLDPVPGPAKAVAAPVSGEGNGESYPMHLGGGTYRLSNGEKVKGREEAEAAEAALHK